MHSIGPRLSGIDSFIPEMHSEFCAPYSLTPPPPPSPLPVGNFNVLGLCILIYLIPKLC